MIAVFFDKEINYKLIKTNFTGFPKMLRIKQKFSDEHVMDIDGAVHEEISKLPLPDLKGKRVAVTAGSARKTGMDVKIGKIHLLAPSVKTD